MIQAAMDGVQIMVNPSASNVQKGKLARKIQMIKQLTQRHGGSYLYTNVKGCTGDRIYFDGGCIFTENGVVKGLSNLNTIQDIIVTPVIVNVTNIRSFRLSNKSFLKSGNGVSPIPRIKVDLAVCQCQQKYTTHAQQTNYINQLIQQYEYPHARYEPSLYLWDFLRKSEASGFFLPLSGGLDSSAVAMMVYTMCCIVYHQIIDQNNQKALSDLRKIIQQPEFVPKSPQQICNKLFFTCYMQTQFCTEQSQKRANEIAKQINSQHRILQVLQQSISSSQKNLVQLNSSLKGIQSRIRMLISYLFAENQFIMPKQNQKRNKQSHLLVLSCCNLDEKLTGNFTKYDCSSGDINPIGSFSRSRVQQYLEWIQQVHDFDFIKSIIKENKEKNELSQIKKVVSKQYQLKVQYLTYNEISLFGRLRRNSKLGPVSMFQTICGSEANIEPRIITQKVKLFFNNYSKNRHKTSVLTPCFHYYPEGCQDARLDLRPIFYATNWDYHFDLIDKKVKQMEELAEKQRMNNQHNQKTKQAKRNKRRNVKPLKLLKQILKMATQQNK